MNRRQLILIPGVALMAEQGLVQAQSLSKSVTGISARRSQKLSLKLTRTSSVAKVPKSEAKAAKYVKTLGAFLGLSSEQQQQASTILAAARGNLTSLKTSMKPARQSLRRAVSTNDIAGISQASVLIGNLKAQKISAAAVANAAIYQMLSSDQQAKLAQLHA